VTTASKTFTVTVNAPAGNPVTAAAYQVALAQWASDMNTWGRTWGAYYSGGASQDEKLGAQYYDAQWVFRQIGQYRNETSPWNVYAEAARVVYVENYLEPSGFGAQGYRRFPHGVYFDYLAGGNSTLQDVVRLSTNPAFSYLSSYRTDDYTTGTNAGMSREVAYALQANIYAEKAGQARYVENSVARPGRFVQWAASHFKSWKTAVYSGTEGAPRFAPFMAALLLHALIEWIEWEEANGRNPNATWDTSTWPTIEAMMDDFLVWMRNTSLYRTGPNAGQRMWNKSADNYWAFYYEDITSTEGLAFDLNNLIAYPYAWFARRLMQTAPARVTDANFLMVVADDLFIGHSKYGFLGNGKQFNQAYRLSMLYRAIKTSLPTLGYGGIYS
jgi:hypothetical protein